jgi:exodeoxyribonuclease X
MDTAFEQAELPFAAIPETPPEVEEDLPMPAPQRLTDTRFIMADTETTGLDPEKDRVIELAMRNWSVNPDLVWPDRYESLYDPDMKIPPVAMATHHITNKMLEGAPSLESEREKIMAFVGDAPLVAYNAEYDRSMMPFLYDHLWIDVQRLAMNVWHIGQENADGFPLGSFKQQELRYWLGYYEVDGDAHRADADIQVTGLVWNAGIRHLLDHGLPDDYGMFLAYLSAPIQHKTLPFGPFIGRVPEELTVDEIRSMFRPDGFYFAGYQKFDILDRMRPILDRHIVQGEKVRPPAQRRSFSPAGVS